MGLPQNLGQDDIDDSMTTAPYPVQTRSTEGDVKGNLTTVTCMSFSDKILVTITQKGILAQWVTVPLFNENPTGLDTVLNDFSTEDALLPASRLTPHTLLGAGSGDREMMGHLYASQIASAIVTKSPAESRSLVLGLGLPKVVVDPQVFSQIMELVLQCL